MKKTSKIVLAISVITLLMGAGCSSDSDSDSSSSNDKVTTISGTASDGVINGATVCIDVNDNDKCDSGEPTAKTNVYGKFKIDSSGVTGKLIVSGGKDMGTGKPFTGKLKAPASSTVVTPLTSVIQALVESGKSINEAETTIKTALGVPEHIEITNYNPFEKIDSSDKDNAKKVLLATAQLQTVVHAVSSAVAGVNSNTSAEDNIGVSIEDAMDEAMASIASTLQDAVTISTAEGNATAVTLDTDLVVKVTKETTNKVFAEKADDTPAVKEAKLRAKVAVKTVAEQIATAVVAVAEETKKSVDDANTSDGITLAFNGGMIVTNDALQTVVENNSSAVLQEIEDKKVNVTPIAKQQELQEKAEDNVTKMKLEEANAMLEALKAKEQAEAEGASKDDIVAAEKAAAKAAAAAAAKAEAEAEAAAAAAAVEAAKKEAEIAAEISTEEEILGTLKEVRAKALTDAADAANAARKAEEAAKTDCKKSGGEFIDGHCEVVTTGGSGGN